MNRCRKLYKNADVDTIIILSEPNTYYLSGFKSSNCIILITEDKQYFITDLRYYNEAVIKLKDFDVLVGDFDTIKKFIKKKSKIGFDNNVPYTKYIQLKNLVDDCILQDITSTVEEMRAIKDEQEISFIKKAQEITEIAYNNALKEIKEGIQEIELAAIIEYNFLKNGAMIAFDSIVAFGENGASPHAHRTNRKLKNGDFITMDIGARWNGYCSDMTRTVAFGSITKEQETIYNTVFNAHMLAINNMRANIMCSNIDKIARDYIKDCGYGQYFTHSLGHGVGIDIHEQVYLSPKSESILKNGMVVTVEPGIYIPNLCGVRIEDTVVINDDKAMTIANINKKLLII